MILQIILILLAVNAAVFLFNRLSIPTVLGMILVGIAFSAPQINSLLHPDVVEVLPTLAQYGLYVLMFIAGLEVSWAMLVKEGKDSMIVASFGLVTPFIVGTASMLLMGYSLLVSACVGIAMSITAEATTAEVLLEMKKIKTRLGALMVGSGILDDIIGISAFSVFAFFFFKVSESGVYELFNLLFVILAFFAGLSAHVLFGREKKFIKYFEVAAGFLLVPFFFVEMGMHFEIASLFNSWELILLIIFIAMAGKILGVVISRIFVKLSLKQAYIVGWGMNSRGAIELVLVYSGYKLGILNSELYSAIIVMTFVSTLIFPIVLTRMVKANKNIMN